MVEQSKKLEVFSSYNLIDFQVTLASKKGQLIDYLSTKNAIATLENFLPYFSKK